MVFKNISTLVIFTTLIFFSNSLLAQTIQEGCIDAGFGIDADNVANLSMFGDDACNPCVADDWFFNNAFPGSGIGVIDTTGAALYQNLLWTGNNTTFFNGMSIPPNSIVNGRRMIDGNYVRDFYGWAWNYRYYKLHFRK